MEDVWFPRLTEKQQVEQQRFSVEQVIKILLNEREMSESHIHLLVQQWFEQFEPEVQAALVHYEPIYLALDVVNRRSEEARFQRGELRERYQSVARDASNEWWAMNPQVFNRVRSRFEPPAPSQSEMFRS